MRTMIRKVAALTALAMVLVAGPAAAQDNGRQARTTGTSTGKTAPVPVLNNGESATFRVVDTGRSIVITGTGRGMAGAKVYVSLIYPDKMCATQPKPSGLTINGAWQSHGSGRQGLLAVYEGAAYRAVKGQIGSVSIREVTAVTGPQALMTATLTPRACAALDSQR